jgi:DNA-binding GntR family transcriptional regulator
MVKRRVGRSLGEDVYDSIRRDIFRGVYVPGERLHLNQLAQLHEVSLGVVREATARLASEQLLEATPQHGVRVRTLSIPDLLDLTRTRVEMEGLALRRALTRGGLVWETALVAAHHTLAGTPMTLDDGLLNEDWITAHDVFHAALVDDGDSAWLMTLRRQLFDASELYRHWAYAAASDDEPSITRGISRDPTAVMREHKQMLEAALSRDIGRAIDLLTKHFDKTARALIDAGGARYQTE